MKLILKLSFFLSFTFFSQCQTTPKEQNLGQSHKKFVKQQVKAEHGFKGAVSTAHPIATKIAQDILSRGGHAVDAAIAASLILSVVRPQSTGIGGGGFSLVFEKAHNKVKVFDFRERAPVRATRDMYLDKQGKPKAYMYNDQEIPKASVNGHLAVAVPGLMRGLETMHKAYGRLPWPELVQPAIDVARKGFTVYPSLARASASRAKVLEKFPESKALFLPQGRPLAVGQTLRQPDLAWTLARIAQFGANEFYHGQVGRKLLKELNSGIIRDEDFHQISTKQRPAVRGSFRGHHIVSMPPPSSGGVHIIQMLNMLEQDRLAALTPPLTYLHLLAEVMRRAFHDRARYLGDPDFFKVPTEKLINKDYAASLRQSVSEKVTPSHQLSQSLPVQQESRSTTHFSIVDTFGNAVSSTQTINHSFGSGVVAAGTGIVLNNEMDDFSLAPGVPNGFGVVGSEANAVAARKTPLSSMSPTFVFDNRGLKMVVGSPGGPMIISATLQVILNVLAFKMSLSEAVHHPRIHHQWLPDTLFVENDLNGEKINRLKNLGHNIRRVNRIGDVQAIMRSEQGWVAVSDGRDFGSPAGVGSRLTSDANAVVK